MATATHRPPVAERALGAERRARVGRVVPEEEYGLLETEEGRELFFHRSSVQGDFHRLLPGAPVRFAEALGEDGPEAVWVLPLER
ncbi:MAG: cold shock domain-containing protein [Acidobacteria bacterium]|nr:cold shock domain-containing protein [Acidobacteriota bacterium]MCB9378871.1 cold shock domain-containing protein [Holophagales bacterium]